MECKTCKTEQPIENFRIGRKSCRSCCKIAHIRAKQAKDLLKSGLKKCRLCEEVKAVDLFKVGRRLCKRCDCELTRKRYGGLTEEKKQARKIERDNRRMLRPSHHLWLGAKRRAQKEGLAFDIEESDIICPKFCPVLGIEMQVGIGFRSDASPSLDKIIPELGYTKGNICVISYRANRFKSDASIEEIRKLLAFLENKIITK
jgi:hypothetical protein